MSDAETPSALLERVGHGLAEAGYDCTLVEPGDELPIPALVVELAHEGRPDATIACSVVPTDPGDLGAMALLQLYAPVPLAPGWEDRRGDVGELLLALNLESAMGFFAISPSDGPALRAVVPMSRAQPTPSDVLVEAVALFGFLHGHYGGLLSAVAEGQMALDEALAALRS